MRLVLSGACHFKDFLNGLIFVEQGTSANGAPWFRSRDGSQYLYYDLDCNGGDNGVPRWIMDADAPNPALQEDLDEDVSCNYHSRIDSLDQDAPPEAATWQMFCGHQWVHLTIRLDLVADSNDLTMSTTPNPIVGASGLVLTGKFCPDKSYLNYMEFLRMGTTASGAPYYKALGLEQYIYYDPSCAGEPRGKPRWIIDADAPDTTRKSDLDGDGACNYHARVSSTDITCPPASAMWRVYCDDQWKDTWVILSARTTSSTTALMILVNGAEGLRARLATALLLPLALSVYALGR